MVFNFSVRTVRDNHRRADYSNIVLHTVITVYCVVRTRTERSSGRDRNRGNRPHRPRRNRKHYSMVRLRLLCVLFVSARAIVSRPSFSVVVFRRPSLPPLLCVRRVSRPWPVRLLWSARVATVLSFVARACAVGGPRDVLNFRPFLFSFAPLIFAEVYAAAVRARDRQIYIYSHSSRALDASFHWTVWLWPSFKKK